ncbi:PD40 domain-containing protein [Micromonospora sp. M51]|uniref:TolB family protein n=1 Tax=Micromonospora sp. M51 TaxID=2824889 RepID=UPI001B397C6F|nr:PD40 domain-containing protein [Micromonospora sp. M51]MBQ1013805.1 PD40 domain-containing protein [Micromonospora sp. M51]
MTAMSTRAKLGVVVASAVLLGTVAAGYAATAAQAPRTPPPVGGEQAVSLAPGPRLLAITDRHVSTVAATDPAGPRTVGGLECLRVYAAAGTGVCLKPETAWSYQVVVLDAELRQTRAVGVPGLPNRARVSASGRMVSWTTFVGGDSYTSSGFSTRTGILDTVTGAIVASLEDFAITMDGRRHRNPDVNYWGVTFTADDNRFYATMSTGGRRYLVRGDVAARTVETLKENVECPSLSPDGTRLAFKEAIHADPAKGWRLSVLDLSSMRVTATAETRSVDDQAAWLDSGQLAYTLRRDDGQPDVWSVPADGSGTPALTIPGAESPSPLT